jgi:hypothetical protein
MNIKDMTKADFENVLEWWETQEEKRFKSLVIIPTDELHDSGYMCMSFVAVGDNDEPLFSFGGGSDVIHLDGLGGYGKNWVETGRLPATRPVQAWRIDCLPCGYLRLFCRGKLSCNYAVSDFEIYWEELEENS